MSEELETLKQAARAYAMTRVEEVLDCKHSIAKVRKTLLEEVSAFLEEEIRIARFGDVTKYERPDQKIDGRVTQYFVSLRVWDCGTDEEPAHTPDLMVEYDYAPFEGLRAALLGVLQALEELHGPMDGFNESEVHRRLPAMRSATSSNKGSSTFRVKYKVGENTYSAHAIIKSERAYAEWLKAMEHAS